MDVRGKRLLVIGGAGLIGSHLVDELLSTDAGEIVVFDNFARGTRNNLARAASDPRVRIFEAGGDICQPDILNAAMQDVQGVSTCGVSASHEFRGPRSTSTWPAPSTCSRHARATRSSGCLLVVGVGMGTLL
jgi:nucleoside-diphosphate-sugar epimerase